MAYRDEIIKMIDSVTQEDLLRFIYLAIRSMLLLPQEEDGR